MTQTRKQRIRANDAGVTLIELMFAAGILAMSLSIIFGSLISISVLGNINEQQTQAMSQLSSLVEEISQMQASSLPGYTPPPLTGPGVSQSVTLGIVRADGVVTPMPAAGAGLAGLPNPAHIQVTLNWVDNNGRAYSMTAVAVKDLT